MVTIKRFIGYSGFQMMITAVCWLMISTSSVFAADYVYYVDGSNVSGDSLDGMSIGTAWKTIFHAISVLNTLGLASGDTVTLNILKGTYSIANGETGVDTDYLLSFSNNPKITIIGMGSGNTIMDGTGAAASWPTGLTISSNNVSVKGIQFFKYSNAGIIINQCTTVKVLGCEFIQDNEGIHLSGVSQSTVANSPLIMGNTFNQCSPYGISLNNSGPAAMNPIIKKNNFSACDYSINLYASTSTGFVSPDIEDNDIKYSKYDGIYIYSMQGTVGPKILGNTLEGNQTAIGVSGYNGSSAPLIRNNLITYTSNISLSYGIYVSSGMTGTIAPQILHNTIDGNNVVNTSGTGILISGQINLAPVIRYNIVARFFSNGIQVDPTLMADIDYNDAFGNGTNYAGNITGPNNISVDPLLQSDYSIPQNSPCVDAIPANVENPTSDPLDFDIIGTSRPRASGPGKTALYDMGCYEFPYMEYTLTMPPGTGLASDYRLLTVPLTSYGNSLKNYLEGSLGTYDSALWRIYTYTGTAYMEINDAMFQEYFPKFQGIGFWAIDRNSALPKTTVIFQGTLVGNRKPISISLIQGWNVISLPWPKSPANPDDIQLQNILIMYNSGSAFITDNTNTMTEKAIWDYTSTGYVSLSNPTDVMTPGKAYWIYVNSTNASMMIPPDNGGTYFAVAKSMKKNLSAAVMARSTGMTPPPPPGVTLKADGGKGCFIGGLYSEL